MVLSSPGDEFAAAGFVYVIFIKTAGIRFFKIGMAKTFSARFDQHQCSSPFEVKVACAYFVGNMRTEERELHSMFAYKRIRGEWFALEEHDLQIIAARCIADGIYDV